MTDIQRPTSIREQLDAARTEAPSEVIARPDGSQHVIQWQGTPAPRAWVTSFVDGLVLARLIEPFPEVPKDLAPEDQAQVQSRIDARLDEWHKPLAGLPKETLTAAAQHFRRYGVPDGRWGYLRPSDVSSWVRAKARRRIPDGQECPEHPDHWGHSCQPCKDARRASVTPDLIRRIREQAKETP